MVQERKTLQSNETKMANRENYMAERAIIKQTCNKVKEIIHKIKSIKIKY